MLAKDIMRRRVTTVRPEMTLRELVALFDKKAISGAPVVGPGGDLIGVVSQTDLLREERRAIAGEPAPYHLSVDAAPAGRGVRYRIVDGVTVASLMTPWVISFEEDTPVRDLARQMLAKRIHRVVITREGRMCGIVTSMDMMRALLAMISGKK